jgi:hypothetical protein
MKVVQKYRCIKGLQYMNKSAISLVISYQIVPDWSIQKNVSSDFCSCIMPAMKTSFLSRVILDHFFRDRFFKYTITDNRDRLSVYNDDFLTFDISEL